MRDRSSRSADLLNLPPAAAAAQRCRASWSSAPAPASWSTRAAGAKRAKLWPSAADALRLPEALRRLPPKPVYARAPDARAPERRMMATPALDS